MKRALVSKKLWQELEPLVPNRPLKYPVLGYP